MNNHDSVAAKIDRMSIAQVKNWLMARHKNCHRLAEEHPPEDRDGWLEDAAYFAAAIALIEIGENSHEHS